MKDVFITENFLLQNESAVRLFHEYARDMPIIDYHCHLSPEQVAVNKRFDNLTQIWLAGDHYKWRAMRTAGVDERFITGDAGDWEKFEQWARVAPLTLRNPIYHWTHLELKRPFGISDRLLNPSTAKSIWDQCNAMLAKDEFSARGIMRQMNVVVVCTTDDPIDSLEHHIAIAADSSFPVKVLPTFRPDKGMAVEDAKTFNAWVDRLAEVADIEIKDMETYLAAIRARHDFFHSVGCRLSDHGIEGFYAAEYSNSDIEAIFRRVRRGNDLRAEEIVMFKSAMLHEFALLDHETGWTQQFHFGALRNNNSRQFAKLGPDTGYDSIADPQVARDLSAMLDRLDRKDCLAKTVLYNLNPVHNDLIATMIGNFQDGRAPGKLQFGSGWWFQDQMTGMLNQMNSLSSMGLLSLFVGMLTDSRSFLSYTRHEYFRRILCNLLGSEMETGLIPRDFDLVGSMVKDISYRNAARYFGFGLQVDC